MKKFLRAYLFIILMIFTIVGSGCTPSAKKIPIPEFYGMYLLSKGNLIKLKEAYEEKRVKTFDGSPGIATISGIDITDKKLSFIIYQRDLSIERIKLYKLKYVYDIDTEIDKFLIWERFNEVNLWMADSKIELKIAPIEGKPDMCRLIIDTPFSDGVYVLVTSKGFGDFSVNYKERLEEYQNKYNTLKKARRELGNLGALHTCEGAYFAEMGHYVSCPSHPPSESMVWGSWPTGKAYDSIGFSMNEPNQKLCYQYSIEVTQKGFIITAKGNLDLDSDLDIWQLDQDRNLIHVQED